MSDRTALVGFGLPFWLDLIPRPVYPALPGNVSADVAVIGAGICGLKLASCLARYGLTTVVLEGQRVGAGASSRNQGSINHGAALSYDRYIARAGREAAQALWQLGLENHRLLREQIEELAIDCDYQVDGYASLVRQDRPGWQTQMEEYGQEAALLQADGFDVDRLDRSAAIQAGGSPLYAGGLRYNSDAQFHSGKYLVGLAQAVSRSPAVTLYEEARVQRIEAAGSGARVICRGGTVSVAAVFLATNALAPQLVPDLEAGLRAERGQVFVTAPLSARPCRGSFGTAMAWWREILEPDGRYRLLFGGGRERDEPDSLFPQFDAAGRPHPSLEREGFAPSVAHQRRLDAEFARLFPHLVGVPITHRWGGLQSFTADDLPQVGLFDAARALYGIAGLCGRGNCYSNVGAEYLAGRIAGQVSAVETRFGSLFESMMAVRRPSAAWEPWHSVYR